MSSPGKNIKPAAYCPGEPRTPLPTTKGYFGIISLVLALIFAPAHVTSAPDISGIPENKDALARKVMTTPTISRVSELSRLPVSLRQYEFLLDHPRLSMTLAHIYDPSLDLYKVEVRRNGLVHIADPGGLAGDMELVNAIPGRRVYFVSGHFDILKMRFYGRVVLLMSYSERGNETVPFVDSTTTSYIKINSAFVGFIAKMMAFLFPRKVDERIGRFANAVRKVAIAVHDSPADAYRKLAASGEVGSRELKGFSEMFLRAS
jgi:hypothetical protein